MNLKPVFFPFLLAVLLPVGENPASAQESPQQRVFQYVLSSSKSVEDTAFALANGVSTEGMTLLSNRSIGVPDECSFSANVISFFDPVYASSLMELNKTTAPYAWIDRINVFEDEKGVHVATINTKSILRTILLDDPVSQEIAAEHDRFLREFITSLVDGVPSEKQYGQVRKKGYIGRTMGVMAGGPFNKKIKTISEIPETQWETVAMDIAQRMSEPESVWGLHVAYSASLPEYQIAVLGISGEKMEAKSFSIVRAGSDKSRKKFSCPGVAHAGAYPLELIVRQDGPDVDIEMVSAMFRMKMYFEDAGKWAFMKNMGMPGSIAYELKLNAVEKMGTD